MTIQSNTGHIHYAHGMPGIGIVTLCGSLVNKGFVDKSLKASEDQEKVTCHLCLNLIKEIENLPK